MSDSILTLLAQEAPKNESFWNSGTFGFILLLLVLFLGWFLAKVISSSLRLPEYRSRLLMAIMPVLIGCLLIFSGWPPKLGVDLKGGMNLVGSLNLADFPADQRPTAQEIIDQLIKRVNPSGAMEIVIRPLGEDKIEVTIPDVNSQEADDIWQLLVTAGKLEFRITGNRRFHRPQFELAEKKASEGYRQKNIMNEEGETVAFWCPIARSDDDKYKDAEVKPYKYPPNFSQAQLYRDRNTGRIVDFSDLRMPQNPDLMGAAFAQYCEERGIRPEILMIQPKPDENVEGRHLAAVTRGTDPQTGRPIVQFETTAEGASRLGMLTGMNEPDASDNKRLLGIVIDDKLHSAPSINSRITSRGIIEGDFTVKEIDKLVNQLQSGKMKAALNKNPISKNYVESLLGQELKEKGFWAIGVSLVLVLIFMVFYYRFAGIVAAVSLVLNIVLILAIVMAIQQPLTLTGLAGLVLTVGMSVDANVLIFERIREEMDRGSTLRMSIRNGFDKARTTIVDANVTTLITALVLYAVGTEQVKGFAVTLILGILMSMFTAIFCSRIIFDIAERKRWLTKLNMTRILQKKKFDFIGKIGLTGVVSALLIGVGIAGMFMLGSKLLDHDLRGGSTIRVVFNEAQEQSEVQKILDDYEMNVNGEKIEFSVASFGDADATEGGGKIFRIDSNLPAWEGGPEEDRWMQLDEVMADQFKGKLMLHKVDVISGDGSSNPEVGSWKTQGQGQNASWNAPAISAISVMNPTMLIQDAGDQEAASLENEAESTADESDPQTGEQSAATDDDENQDSDSPSLQGLGGDIDDVTPAYTGPATTETVVHIEPAILGKSLRAEIIAVARELGTELSPEEVELLSDDILEGEDENGTVSADWTIKLLNVAQKEDGAAIIKKWSEELNTQPYFPTSSKVGSQIAGSMRVNAMLAIIFSLIGIIAYIWARFQNIAFGLAAVVALCHDVLVVLAMIALSHYVAGALGFLLIDKFKISLEIIAALLTVIGYSLNDTIVVFDRIREVRGKRKQITSDMINTSISQTLSRTILTSLTTFVVVFILYCFGGGAIHGFAFSLVVGVIVGTYSSIFIASPALLWLMNSIGLSPEPVESETVAGQV